MTYLALRRWQYNLFWVNWASTTLLVNSDTLWAHYTRSAERSDYVTGCVGAGQPKFKLQKLQP